jgi:hypothetical protein
VVAVGTIVFLAGAGAVGFVFWKVSQDLPDYEGLAKYEPPVLTRVKTPTKAMRDFCAGQPNAAVNPLVVIGHDHPMIYDWTCKGKQPTVAKQNLHGRCARLPGRPMESDRARALTA